VTVLALGLDELERRVGERGVIPPDREQLVLPPGGLVVQVADAADDEAGGDLPALLRGERGVLNLGDLGVGDPGPQVGRVGCPARSWVSSWMNPGLFGAASLQTRRATFTAPGFPAT
jgi:hypothetical protein